ncbi:hypothetical protein [Marinobacter segnicrescens]|uniref:hypothetical protein n=1 Tax=Marinobacter segnicrescens TaxID=430453 RepID=UPI003A93BD9B
MKDKPSTLGILLLAGFLSGCSTFYTPGMGELKELCEKDGGITIRQEVRTGGYYDSTTDDCYGCWNKIIRSGYDFVEFENRIPTPYKYFGGERGFYRIYKAPKDHPNCNAQMWKWALSKKVGSEQYDKFFADYCVASESIDEPTAQYGYFKEKKEWQVNDWYKSTISWSEYTVKDLSAGEVAAKNVMYKLNPYPKSALAYGKVISCSSVLPRERFPQPIILPLKPTKEGK